MKNELIKRAKASLLISSILLNNNLTKIKEIDDKDILFEVLTNNAILNKLDNNIVMELIITKCDNEYFYKFLTNNIFLSNMDLDNVFKIFAKLSLDNQIKYINNDLIMQAFNNYPINNFCKIIVQNNDLSIFDNKIINRLSGNQIIELMNYLPNDKKIKLIINNNLLTKIEAKDISIMLENNDLIDLLLHSKQIPLIKAMYIINNLEKINEEKNNILNKYYNTNSNDFLENFNLLQLKYINMIKEFKYEDELNLIKEDIKNDEILQNNILEILNNLINKVNQKENINRCNLEIIFNALTNKLSKDMNLDISSAFFEEHEAISAVYMENNEIGFNISSLAKDKLDVIEMMNSIIHELTHVKQSENMKAIDYSFDTLKMVKDKILNDQLIGYHANNYVRNTLESDARCKAYVSTYKLLCKINKNIAKNYLNKEIRIYKGDLKYYQSTLRTNKQEKDSYLEEYFDEFIDEKTILTYMSKYPILSLEYNESGKNKSLSEILLEYANLILKKDEIGKDSVEYQKYIFYLRLINDKKNVFSKTYKRETYDKYKEAFSKLKNINYENNLIYKKLVDDFMDISNYYYDTLNRKDTYER